MVRVTNKTEKNRFQFNSVLQYVYKSQNMFSDLFRFPSSVIH